MNTSTDVKRRNYKFYLRKAHRYLGVLIGIQFLFWTSGGLYFSWTEIRQIRGDDLRAERNWSFDGSNLSSPQIAVAEIRAARPDAQPVKVQLVEILGDSFYEIGCRSEDGKMTTFLARASDGRLRPPISEDEARRIASSALRGTPEPTSATYLTEDAVSADHEYREKPLPAWAVGFRDDLVVYVSAGNGQVGAVRNRSWRVFDFLWMLHTLDFKARDDINNYLLRGFSLLGLVTIGSGFGLFFASSRLFRRRRPKGRD